MGGGAKPTLCARGQSRWAALERGSLGGDRAVLQPVPPQPVGPLRLQTPLLPLQGCTRATKSRRPRRPPSRPAPPPGRPWASPGALSLHLGSSQLPAGRDSSRAGIRRQCGCDLMQRCFVVGGPMASRQDSDRHDLERNGLDQTPLPP